MTVAKKIDIHSISDVVYYSEDSPTCLLFTKDNSVAGMLDSSGYYRVSIRNQKYLVHRVIFSLFNMQKDIESFELDHIDGDKLNNKLDNLRLVTSSTNSRNKRKMWIREAHSIGVTFESTETGYNRIKSSWYNMNGRLKTKSFSINKLGIMVAFRDAVAYREKMIKELNEQGAGYTERHGK